MPGYRFQVTTWCNRDIPCEGIAAQFGTSVHDLASANGIPDPDFISVGQKLYY